MNVFDVLREKIKNHPNVYRGFGCQLTEIDTDSVFETINQVEQEYNNGWIPCSERLPSKEEYLKDDGRFIVTDGNRVYQSIYDIYINQCFKTLQLNCLVDLGYQSNFEVDKRVIAWQPLPKSYREEG